MKTLQSLCIQGFALICLASLLGSCSSSSPQEKQAETVSEDESSANQRPNAILILADDMGFSDLGCYGSSISTPHLDKLANQGLRFTQFSNTSKCFPSRACLLTGVYAQQCGMGKTSKAHLTNALTLGEAMRLAGYRTLMAGKHHGLDNMYDRGFDRYFGLRDGACNFFNPGNQREGEPVPAHKKWAYPRKWCIDDSLIEAYTPPQKDFYTTDYFTNYAIDYLEEYKEEEKPFFLYLSYTAPHAPLHAWPEDIAKYKGKFSGGYDAIRQARYDKMLALGLIDTASYPLSDPIYRKWDALSEEERALEEERMEVYAAMIDRLDQNVGRVLAKLKEIGKEDNTLIFFASDNGGSPGIFPLDKDGFNETSDQGVMGSMERWEYVGPHWANVSNTPYRYYKNWSHHGGTCTPLIAYWPQKIAAGVTEYPGHFIDFMPTLLEVAEASFPASDTLVPLQGESLVPALTQGVAGREKPMYWQWQEGKAIRKGKWRLVYGNEKDGDGYERLSEGPGKGDWRLYDMEADKTETIDLSAQHPEIVQELTALHDEWMKEVYE